jgi:hypothetical protein
MFLGQFEPSFCPWPAEFIPSGCCGLGRRLAVSRHFGSSTNQVPQDGRPYTGFLTRKLLRDYGEPQRGTDVDMNHHHCHLGGMYGSKECGLGAALQGQGDLWLATGPAEAAKTPWKGGLGPVPCMSRTWMDAGLAFGNVKGDQVEPAFTKCPWPKEDNSRRARATVHLPSTVVPPPTLHEHTLNSPYCHAI